MYKYIYNYIYIYHVSSVHTVPPLSIPSPIFHDLPCLRCWNLEAVDICVAHRRWENWLSSHRHWRKPPSFVTSWSLRWRRCEAPWIGQRAAELQLSLYRPTRPSLTQAFLAFEDSKHLQTPKWCCDCKESVPAVTEDKWDRDLYKS